MSTKAEELANASDELANEASLIHLQSWEYIHRLLRNDAEELRRLAEIERQYLALKASIGEPVAIVDVVVPHLESFLLKHIPGADFPRVGGFLYAIKDKQP